MPSLLVTSTIRSTCSLVLEKCKISADDKKEVLRVKEAEHVDLSALRMLLSYSQKISHKYQSPHYLYQLLKGSTPFHYVAPPKARDPELEKRVQRLRAEEGNRQYRKMVKNIITPQGIHRIQDSMELKDTTSQMSVGLNIIVTMFSCFVIGFYLGSKYFEDEVLGMCVGIICLIIGMMVDMWLFVINASTLDKHIEKENKKRKLQSKLLPNYQGLIKYD